MDIYIKARGVIECSSVRKGRYEDMLRGGRVGHGIVEVGSKQGEVERREEGGDMVQTKIMIPTTHQHLVR